MTNDKIEAALERIVHESPYNGPIVAQAYKDLVAGVKLFGVPASHYHRFLSLIEQEAMDSGPRVLARLAKLEGDVEVARALHALEYGSDHHIIDASCWCSPEIVGAVVKHR